jgi:luciferase family oxidoreductase group 1
MSPFTLGALDLTPVPADASPVAAIQTTLQIAPVLEGFGYSRYWMAEHHGPFVSHSSPELLVPVIAGLTKKMRVGVAGILLRLHSPLKVAKNFRLLEAVYPGRIDLGIARATTKPEQEVLLRDGNRCEVDFEKKVGELVSFLRENSGQFANPQDVPAPPIWMLGSNTTSMRLASVHGTSFCYAAFLAPKGDPAGVLSAYRAEFTPSEDLPEPKYSIAVAGICASTDARALELLGDEYPVGAWPGVVGSQETCLRILRTLHEDTGATEFVFLDMCLRAEDKVESYRLLAEALL